MTGTPLAQKLVGCQLVVFLGHGRFFSSLFLVCFLGYFLIGWVLVGWGVFCFVFVLVWVFLFCFILVWFVSFFALKFS